MATPKEAAVLFLTKETLERMAPKNASYLVNEMLAQYFPQDKLTPAKMEKIQAAYQKEVGRIRKMYATYLTGRGIK